MTTGSPSTLFANAQVQAAPLPVLLARRHVLLALALAALGVLATLDAWRDIWSIAWGNEEASQVLLVPLIAAWLVYVRRGRIAGLTRGAAWAGPAVVAAGWGLRYVGDARLWQSVWHLGAVAVVLGCALTALGGRAAGRFLPAVLVLALLVPVPARARVAVTVPLQTATARATEAVFGTFGTGLERSGNLLTVNGVDVSVAEACSGMRMTYALGLVAYAMVFATPLRPWARAAVLGCAPLFAVTCNVVRLVPTVWAYGSLPTANADAVHDAGGWVMLFIGYFLLVGLVGAMEWLGLPVMRPRGLSQRREVLA